MRMMKCFGKQKTSVAVVAAMISLTAFAGPARAAEHQVRVPLQDGKLSLSEMSSMLADETGLPFVDLGTASVDLRQMGSSVVVTALNRSLGDGFRLSVEPSAAVIRFDTDKLPHSIDQAKAATRTFTATVAPEATACQARKYGLILPAKVHADRPMVILLHGVDCTVDCLQPMAAMLETQGYQVAYFGYPDDQGIADSATLFTDHLTALRETFPATKVDVVAFSMGGLVARSTIEGPAYPGGVDHLILLAPPNHGSGWAPARIILEAREQWELHRQQGWSPTWMITDGLGEAARDLKPDSDFLKSLNTLPRRDGVKYTIINGNVHPVWKVAGNAAEKVVSIMGPTVSGWIKADKLADKLRDHHADSDGPVSQVSTQLDGVADVVTVAADHNGLYQPCDGQAPPSWDIIKERLKQ